jgi:hypothetical protein
MSDLGFSVQPLDDSLQLTTDAAPSHRRGIARIAAALTTWAARRDLPHRTFHIDNDDDTDVVRALRIGFFVMGVESVSDGVHQAIHIVVRHGVSGVVVSARVAGAVLGKADMIDVVAIAQGDAFAVLPPAELERA